MTRWQPAICVCTDEALAHEIASQVEYQAANLSRAEIIRQSISRHGAIVLAEDISKAMELANMIAPEHLELCVKEPEEALKLVQNAGAVFMGHYSPEPLGDYLQALLMCCLRPVQRDFFLRLM